MSSDKLLYSKNEGSPEVHATGRPWSPHSRRFEASLKMRGRLAAASSGEPGTQSSSREDFHMETTATGVKISFAAPQIIAWVSQILPALPRQPGMEPMIQGSTS